MGYFTPEVGTKSTRTEPEPAEDPSLHGVFFRVVCCSPNDSARISQKSTYTSQQLIAWEDLVCRRRMPSAVVCLVFGLTVFLLLFWGCGKALIRA